MQLCANYCQTPVLGLGLALDNNDNDNNDNDNDNNPHLNFSKGTVLWVKEQGLGIIGDGARQCLK